MTQSSTPKPSSTIEDLIDAFVAPAAMFSRRVGQSAVAPFLIVAALLVVLYYANFNAMSGIIDTEVDKAVAAALESNPEMDDAAIGQMRRVIEISTRYSGLVALPVVLLALGAVVFVSIKLLGGSGGYGTGLTIASFAYLPRVLESAGVAIQYLLLDPSELRSRFSYSFGIGRFLDPASTPEVLYNVLGRLDLITIWVTVLVAVGMTQMAKVERGKAIGGAIGLWVLGTLPAVLGALNAT